MKISEIMSPSPRVCRLEDNLDSVARVMRDYDCGFVPVISTNGNGAVIGVITDRDICMAAYTQGKPLIEIPVESAMAREVIMCRADDDVTMVEAMMRVNRVRRIPVVDEKRALVGIVSINDLARAAELQSVTSGLPIVTLSEVAGILAAICSPRIKSETGI